MSNVIARVVSTPKPVHGFSAIRRERKSQFSRRIDILACVAIVFCLASGSAKASKATGDIHGMKRRINAMLPKAMRGAAFGMIIRQGTESIMIIIDNCAALSSVADRTSPVKTASNNGNVIKRALIEKIIPNGASKVRTDTCLLSSAGEMRVSSGI